MLKKHLILFVFAVFVQFIGFAQSNFYAVDSLREIRIYFYDTDWDYQLDSFYVQGDNERILADLIIDGSPYDSVGVRYKGFSSVSVNRVKNPFNIKLDYVIDDQEHNGVDKLKLSNVIQDPSFVREVLTYEIAANYLPSAKANYANVYVNDTLWGLYTNVEAVNKDFLNDHFGNKYNPFFKCNAENLDITPGGENSNLSNAHGNDSLDYEPYYALKSNYGWESLYNLIDTLNNYSDSVEKILNVDRTLWMHALNYTLVNFDSYIGYGQNYYLYKDKTGQFNPLLWDLNMSFGSFRLTDASSIYFSGFDIAQAQNMDPLLHHTQFSVSPRPLLRNLFLSERNRKMYLAHIRTIVNENFANQSYAVRGQYFQNLIDTSVQNDTNKFYSYADFISNLSNPVTLVTADCPGITQLMDARATYLSNYTGFSGEPTIANITVIPQNFVAGADVWITADIVDATEAILGYRFGDNMAFKTTAMLSLLSPAKSLNFESPAPSILGSELMFESEAILINNKLKTLDVSDLMDLMRISETLADLNVRRNKGFDLFDDSIEKRSAVFAFNGDVYKGFDSFSLSEDKLKYAQNKLLILSGLYGLLRPLDLILPYRLEMGTKINIGTSKNLYAFWKDKTTAKINQLIVNHGHSVVLNLASKEYAKAVDFDGLNTRVVDVEFKELRNGKLKVISFSAKKARGVMARMIVDIGIEVVEDLKNCIVDGYEFSQEGSSSSKLLFIK